MRKIVLVVDDSREHLEIIKSMLYVKYDVVCCESGLEGARYFQEHNVDIVLLDIEMPYIDGFDTLEKMRKWERGMNTPIIGLTGVQSKGTVLKFMSMGGNGYLVKPVERNLLVNTIDSYIKEESRKAIEKKILVVDDNLESLRIVQTFLRDQYVVTALNSSKLAIEYLYSHHPDLILLDYYMTPYSGISVYNMIQKMEVAEDIPIAFITGATDRDTLLECSSVQPPPAGIILKPVKKEELLEKVNQILNQ